MDTTVVISRVSKELCLVLMMYSNLLYDGVSLYIERIAIYCINVWREKPKAAIYNKHSWWKGLNDWIR